MKELMYFLFADKRKYSKGGLIAITAVGLFFYALSIFLKHHHVSDAEAKSFLLTTNAIIKWVIIVLLIFIIIMCIWYFIDKLSKKNHKTKTFDELKELDDNEFIKYNLNKEMLKEKLKEIFIMTENYFAVDDEEKLKTLVTDQLLIDYKNRPNLEPKNVMIDSNNIAKYMLTKIFDLRGKPGEYEYAINAYFETVSGTSEMKRYLLTYYINQTTNKYILGRRFIINMKLKE